MNTTSLGSFQMMNIPLTHSFLQKAGKKRMFPFYNWTQLAA